MTLYTIDFETMPIVNGSALAPAPVGVAIKKNDEPSIYTPISEESYSQLKGIMADRESLLLFHNAKFDLRVMVDHLHIPLPEPTQVLDTMIMAYLIDPREPSLGLKELAHKYCGIPPDEQTELRAWLKARHLSEADIALAPFEMVKRYAEKDTDITYALYNYLAPFFDVPDDGKQDIQTAYDREMRLLPICIEMEKSGVGISPNVTTIYQELQDRFDIIDEELSLITEGAKPGSKAMFNVLRDKGYIDESKVQYTDKGNARYGREFLETYIEDKEVLTMLTDRSRLSKLIGTYLKPFAEAYEHNNGRFYPYYNQTRSDSDYGTRTGRFSSNLQQLPKKPAEGMPSIRSMIVAKNGHILLRRDFSSQEIRVAAHYAEGSLLQAYKDNPNLDVHTFIKEMILGIVGLDIPRDVVKTIVFMKFYGGGAAKLAGMLNISFALATQFFEAFDTALPEIKGLMRTVESHSRSGNKIRTWGGRPYDVEVLDDGREMYYKLGNVLIQGSSADMTKEAMIRYHYHPDRKGRIFMQIHDELICEVEDAYFIREMELLRYSMDNIPGWDVPLLSEGQIGKDLGNMEKYDDTSYYY